MCFSDQSQVPQGAQGTGANPLEEKVGSSLAGYAETENSAIHCCVTFSKAPNLSEPQAPI